MAPPARLQKAQIGFVFVFAGRLSNCSHPLVPEHGGFRCDPSPCRGFPLKSTIHFFCESGYHITNKVYVSRCRHGKWLPPAPACVPIKGQTWANSRPLPPSPCLAMAAPAARARLLTFFNEGRCENLCREREAPASSRQAQLPPPPPASVEGGSSLSHHINHPTFPLCHGNRSHRHRVASLAETVIHGYSAKVAAQVSQLQRLESGTGV